MRCPECRTRRKDFGLFTQHLKTSGHKLCRCGGYHYSHRKGSPYCYENPLAVMHHASRRGEDDEVLLMIAASIVNDTPELADKVKELCVSWKLTKEEHGNEIIQTDDPGRRSEARRRHEGAAG